MEVARASTYWRDLQSIIDYFDDAGAEAIALRFLDAVDATIDSICDFPDLGGPWESDNPRHAGWRFRLVVGFENYVVLYRRNDQHLTIMRVIYGGRNVEELLG